MSDPVHQVFFRNSKSGHSLVGCVCRVVRGTSKYVVDFSRSLSPIGEHKGLDEARELYNDPDNHFAPFTEADRAKW